MNSTTAVAVLGGLFGAFAVPALTVHGLHQLRQGGASRRRTSAVGSILGAVTAVAVAVSASGTAPALIPAMLLWTSSLLALALCDALTRQIPTALVRSSTVGVGALLLGGAAIGGEWGVVATSALFAVASGGALLAAWRIGTTGFGDVRLAALGGLGLGHTSLLGIAAGLGVWGVVLASQAVAESARGGSLQTHVALGPGMVAGFISAALLPA